MTSGRSSLNSGRRNSRGKHSDSSSHVISDDITISSPKGHHIVGMYDSIPDTGEANDYDSDADNQEMYESIENITRARQKSISAVEQGLKHLASSRREKLRRSSISMKNDGKDNKTITKQLPTEKTDTNNEFTDNGHLNNISTGSFSTNSVSAESTISTISSYMETTPASNKERPKSLVWQDFSEFRDRVQQIKKSEKSRRTASPISDGNERLRKSTKSIQEISEKNATKNTALGDITRENITENTESSVLKNDLLKDTESGYSGRNTDATYSHRNMESENVTPSPTEQSPSKTVVSYDSKSSQMDYDDEWDNHEPISSIQSISNSTPIRSGSVVNHRTGSIGNHSGGSFGNVSISSTPGSRQSQAERHLLNVFQQLKTVRGQSIDIVLLERMISDIMALNNQSGYDRQSIDRVCMSTADYIVQLTSSSPVSMTSSPYSNISNWQQNGYPPISRPQSAMYSVATSMHDSPSMGTNGVRRYHQRRYSRY